MYGTIAKFSLKPGMAEQFGKVAAAQVDPQVAQVGGLGVSGNVGAAVVGQSVQVRAIGLVVLHHEALGM